MDVGGWLRSLGLGEYEEKFRDNRIDADVLPQLTADDLKDIGVVAVGDRRRMLAAIAALAGGARCASDPTAEIGARPSPGPTSETLAERRQLTVMFCDLVGSTLLSSRLDPEDMREIISAYHGCCTERIANFGGFIAKYMRDGVLAYFGYPQAHEDDAERAVGAALAVSQAVPRLRTANDEALEVRVGIATGLVVVGDLIGEGAAREQNVVGETPNVAARLQALAGPSQVVISDSTRRLTRGMFDYRDLGGVTLKGLPEAVRAWQVTGARPVQSRFEAQHESGLTPLVGREEELELLLRRWQRAKSGEGQVVLLSGEPGIGKSRLTVALLERLREEPHTRLRYFCSPQHTDSALHPIIGQMERAAGLAHEDSLLTKLDKLDALLAETGTPFEQGPLIADMLSLPNDGRYPTLTLTPQQRRQRTMDALMSQLEALARQSPVLMIFEDVHWIDPSSKETLGRVVDRIIQALSVLLIVTFRPEFDAPWIGQPRVAAITLNRLARREVNAVIDGIVGDRVLPDTIRQDIVERTDGIPLFAEEMTKAVLEAKSEGEAQRTAGAVPSPIAAVPASLHASLMARLDRLGPAKEVAQIGAAIGRVVSHSLLAAVVPMLDTALASALDRLIAAGLLFQQGAPPHANYLFKHALVQDAAYSTLLREARRALHARIADTLVNQFAEIAENQPEVLARHYTEAGLIEKAVVLWGKAGQRSVARSAPAEAVEQLGRALGQFAALHATAATRHEEIKVQVALISPLYLIKGGAAPETKAATERARLLIEQAEALGEPLEDPLLLFTVLYSLCTASYFAFNGDLLRELTAQFLMHAEKQSAKFPLVMGYRLTGIALLCTGDMVQGRAYSERALALYDVAEHRPLAARFGQDARVAALSYRSLALWMLGYPDAALADTEDALKDARAIGHIPTLMYALAHASLAHIYCGNYTATSSEADELMALTDKVGSAFWKSMGMMFQGWVLALTDKAADAVNLISSAMSALELMEARVWATSHLSDLALAYAGVRQFDGAQRCIRDALETMERTKETWCEAEVHRLAGEIELTAPRPDTEIAEGHFARALAISRQQQARSWELRAAMSLSRLKRDQGKRAEARDLLAPIYAWFTEGFETRDLREARAMLDTLAS